MSVTIGGFILFSAVCHTSGETEGLVLTHKNRLLRFGAEMVFAICETKEVEVIIINKGEENVKSEEEPQRMYSKLLPYFPTVSMVVVVIKTGTIVGCKQGRGR